MVNKIVIPLSAALQGKYGSHDLVQGGALQLAAHPEEWSPVWESEGDSGIAIGYKQPTVLTSPQRQGFELRTVEGRYSSLLVLQDIFDESYADPYAVKPVTVYDYVAPEARDIARRYTVRQMIMGMPTLASGTFHDTELLSAGGFTVRFMDYNITRHF